MKLCYLLVLAPVAFWNVSAQGNRVYHSSAIKAFTLYPNDAHPYYANVIDCRNLSGTKQTLKVSHELGSKVYMWSNGTVALPPIDIPTDVGQFELDAYKEVSIRFNMMCNETRACQYTGIGRNDPAVAAVAIPRLDVEVVQYLKIEVVQDTGAVLCRVTPYVFGDTTTFIEKIRATAFELNGGRPF